MLKKIFDSIFEFLDKKELPTGEISTNCSDETLEMRQFELTGVPTYGQRDNVYVPYGSCAPTSNSIAITYCLSLIGRDKKDVGCDPDMQLEDYLNYMIDDKKTQGWIKDNNFKFGGWFLKYLEKGNPARQILPVEAYIFNRLMNQFKFEAKYRALSGYDDYCQTILKTRLPIILAGNFSSVSKVSGHVICGIGFNRIGFNEVIVVDPFGDALKGYLVSEDVSKGSICRYSEKFFIRINKDGSIRFDSIVLSRT